MEVRSIYRYARISAYKARQVTREIQGLPASEALELLSFTPKKAAELIRKTLKSAVANAENNNDMAVDDLIVKEAVVGEAPTLKRFAARARGSGSRIRKRNSHIFITLTDDPAAGVTKPKRSHFSARTKKNDENATSTLAKAEDLN